MTLGKTGQKVTKLGMGSSWAVSPSFVQAALLSGVRYIDTSESYENTRSEQVIGQVLDRTGLRNDVYLVTKTTQYRGVADPAAGLPRASSTPASSGSRPTTSTPTTSTGSPARSIGLLRDPAVKATFER